MTTYGTNKSITASQLAVRVGEVLDDVEAGATITVTRRGKPIAVLSAHHGLVSAGAEASAAAEERAAYLGTGADADVPRAPATALARLVTAPSTRAVMSVFLLHPAAVLHQREIARRADVGLRSAQIALARLEEVGLLASERDGNRLYYRAQRTTRFEELRSLLSREMGFAEVIMRHLRQLEGPIARAFVFGSAATGADRLDSDIDLLVVSEVSDDELVKPIADAQRELGREIDLVSYRPAEFEARVAEGNHFVVSVLSQPRIDLIGANRMSALMTAGYLEERAAQGERGKFECAMGTVHDTGPDDSDV